MRSKTVVERIMPAPDKPTTQDTRFVCPTVDDIKKYIADEGFTIDAEHFHDYYAARGWKFGNKKMIAWRPVIRTWQRRKEELEGVKSMPTPEPVTRTRGLCQTCVNFGERDLTCRRKAPHLTYGTWPNVKPDDWCGDYMKYQAPD